MSNNNVESWKKLEVIDPRSVGIDIKKVNIDSKAPHPILSDVKQEDEIQIRSRQLFIPSIVKHPDNLLLLVLNHGTWGRSTDAFREYTEEEKKEILKKSRSNFKGGPVYTKNFEHLKKF